MSDIKTKLAGLCDRLEAVRKVANHLLVGHGMGLVGSLLLFKEHPDLAPPFDGLYLLILLFGGGFLLGALVLGATIKMKIRATHAIAPRTPPGSNAPSSLLDRAVKWLAPLSIGVSLIAFLIAILLIMLSFCGILAARLFQFFTQPLT